MSFESLLTRGLPVPLLLIGAGLLLAGVMQVGNWARMSRWPTTEATIIESVAARKDIRGLPWTPRIRYRYTVSGQQVESEKFTNEPLLVRAKYNDGPDHQAPSRVQAVLNTYPVGRRVTVHYNPDRIEVAYVELMPSGLVAIVVGATLLLIRAFLLPALLNFSRR